MDDHLVFKLVMNIMKIAGLICLIKCLTFDYFWKFDLDKSLETNLTCPEGPEFYKTMSALSGLKDHLLTCDVLIILSNVAIFVLVVLGLTRSISKKCMSNVTLAFVGFNIAVQLFVFGECISNRAGFVNANLYFFGFHDCLKSVKTDTSVVKVMKFMLFTLACFVLLLLHFKYTLSLYFETRNTGDRRTGITMSVAYTAPVPTAARPPASPPTYEDAMRYAQVHQERVRARARLEMEETSFIALNEENQGQNDVVGHVEEQTVKEVNIVTRGIGISPNNNNNEDGAAGGVGGADENNEQATDKMDIVTQKEEKATAEVLSVVEPVKDNSSTNEKPHEETDTLTGEKDAYVSKN